MDAGEIAALEASTDQEIEAALQFAIDSPAPDTALVTKDVYTNAPQ